MPEERCYLCDGMVKRNDQVVRVHEATMHRRCYEEDIRRGRYETGINASSAAEHGKGNGRSDTALRSPERRPV